MDVSKAFLHGDLCEEVYMTMPQDYVRQGGIYHYYSLWKDQESIKFVNSLYGLKQAPGQWFARLSGVLLGFGFMESKADYNLGLKSKGADFVAILIRSYGWSDASKQQAWPHHRP